MLTCGCSGWLKLLSYSFLFCPDPTPFFSHWETSVAKRSQRVQRRAAQCWWPGEVLEPLAKLVRTKDHFSRENLIWFVGSWKVTYLILIWRYIMQSISVDFVELERYIKQAYSMSFIPLLQGTSLPNLNPRWSKFLGVLSADGHPKSNNFKKQRQKKKKNLPRERYQRLEPQIRPKINVQNVDVFSAGPWYLLLYVSLSFGVPLLHCFFCRPKNQSTISHQETVTPLDSASPVTLFFFWFFTSSAQETCALQEYLHVSVP